MVQSSTLTDASAEQGRGRRMDRIRRLSHVMAVGCLVTSGLLGAAMAICWIVTPTRTLFSQAGLQNAPATEIDILVRLLAFGISMVPLGTLIYGLLSARRCFANFAAGRIFSGESIRNLRAFSIAVAASALLRPFAGAALSVLLSSCAAARSRTMVLNFGSDTIIALIFAGTTAIIAWVMAEALDIADENRQFV